MSFESLLECPTQTLATYVDFEVEKQRQNPWHLRCEHPKNPCQRRHKAWNGKQRRAADPMMPGEGLNVKP